MCVRKNIQTTVFLLVLVVFAGIWLSCSDNGNNGTGPVLFSVTDLAGRVVPFAKYPRRIISLAPSNTEILFALGAGEKVVGRTRFGDYPEAAKSVRDVGDLGNPDRELILSLNPDCITASYKTQPQLLDFFSRNNIPVVISEATSFSEISTSIRLLGVLAGKDNEAERIVKSIETKTKDIEEKLKNITPVRCYYAVSFGQFGNWTAGPGSFLNDMIEKAGGDNLGKIIGKPWGEISPEMIVSLDPDVVILGKYSGPMEDLHSAAGLRELDAVKKNRIITVNDDLVGRPGPRIADGLYEIAAKLHPDIFSAGKDR